MKALRVNPNQQQLQVAEIATPQRAGEALVRVTLAGICNTDLEIVRGYAEFSGTLGHEFVGVVVASPEQAQIGRRVVGEINVGCGQCRECRAGDERHCPQREVLGIRRRDGAFAEFLTLPPRNLFFVPNEITDRAAVFVEPLAAACEILDQVAINDSQRVAVIGDGKLAQLIARVVAITGCELTMIGKHTSKLELAAAAGVQPLLLSEVNPKVSEQFDTVIEASGSESGLELALDLVRPRGTVVLKSTFHGRAAVNTAKIVVNEISIIGSRCGRFARALELLQTNQLDLAPLIAQEFALTDGVAAMEAAVAPGALKVLLHH